MEIIPAIDLKNGRCVRLLQGRDDATTEYSTDPVSVATEWERQGAKRLHIVNLDGAFGRDSANFEIMRTIAESIHAKIQFGGGLRSLDAVTQAFDAGCDKVVLGTAVLENPELISDVLDHFGTERVIVALDAAGGKVATRGWKHISELEVMDVASEVKKHGVTQILYTDIARDGMMSGPDLVTLEQLAQKELSVIASGGIASKEDLIALLALHQPNIVGAIIGKALYERKMVLSDVMKEFSTDA